MNARAILFLAIAPVAFSNQNGAAAAEVPPASNAALQIAVDPRVELVSLIFRLAGNPEYNQGKVESYLTDVEEQFGKFTNHVVVELAHKLRDKHGVSYDACMSMAVLLTDARQPALNVPLTPWPESLDKRWNPESVNQFVAGARQFVKDTAFEEFVQKHRELYQTTEERLKQLMQKEGHLEWFHEYFGEKPQAGFTVIPALLNGGQCYGPHAHASDGKEELFCILGVWETDWHGLPAFRKNAVATIVHEFNHSFANPVIDRHIKELAAPGKKLFQPVAEQMRSQAYGDESAMLRESLVRACVVRYVRHFDGPGAERTELHTQEGRGFLWIKELSDLLGEYENKRDQYPTLESFAPRLVDFFKDYSGTFAEKQAALSAKRPKVVSIKPANGAQDVEPGPTKIEVIFDRPMRDQAWSLVGGGPHFPETTGKPSYDASRTVWTVAVALKPDWDYQFMLNSGSYTAFQSAEGMPLEPVSVKFKTKAGTPPR